MEEGRAQVKSSYQDATSTSPAGEPETGPRIDRSFSFDAWLDSIAEWILRRIYPSFERVAPSHGALPKEAYCSLMRFVSENDLEDYDADDTVKLIREAYLVPMRLMEHRGREYVRYVSISSTSLRRSATSSVFAPRSSGPCFPSDGSPAH